MFSLRRTSAIVLRQFYLMQGSPARVLPLFAWVAIDMVTWGFITKYLNAVSGSGFNFVPSLLGAVLLWDFFIRVMQGVTTTFFEDVWSRNFLNVFATPLSISEYIGGLVLSSIATSSVGLVVCWFSPPRYSACRSFLRGAVDSLFTGVVPVRHCAWHHWLRDRAAIGTGAEWFIWPIPALISPFAGVFYPLATLPQWMRFVSRLLPPVLRLREHAEHRVEAARFASALVWGAALDVIFLLLASWFFRAIYRHAVRTGLIARYSAESLS